MWSDDTARLIGGRWAVSLRLFVIAIPLLLLTQVGFIDARSPSGSLSTVAVSALAGVAVVGLTMWCADVTVLRHRRQVPVPVALVVTVGAIAGALRAITELLVTSSLSHESPGIAASDGRVIGALLTGAVLLPLGAWAMATVDEYRIRRQLLLTELAQARMKASIFEAKAEAINDAVRDAAESELLHITSPLIAVAQADETDSAMVADALLAAAEEGVRPLSRRLWNQEPATSHVSWLASARIALAHGVIPVVPLTILMVAVIGPGVISKSGIGDGLLAVALVGLATWGGLAVSARLPPGRFHALHTFGAVTCSVAILTVLSSALLDKPLSASLAGALAILVALLGLLASSVIVTATAHHSQAVLDAIELSVKEAEVDAQAKQQAMQLAQQEVAGIVHSEVQNALIAAAARLRSDPGSGAHTWVGDLLTELPSSVQERRPGAESLQDLVNSWEGIMEVRCEFPPNLPGRVDQAFKVIAREALMNAYRHGAARHVRLEVVHANSGWTISIVADGTGPPDTRVRGLGLQRIDQVASTWSLDSGSATGSVLMASIPD